MTEEKAALISRIRVNEIHFAWDRYEDGDKILPKLEMFRGVCPKKIDNHKAIVYTLVNYDTTLEQDLERIYTLRDMGYWPYVMIYDKEHCGQEYMELSRWVNNRHIFASCAKFEDYKK